MKFGYVVEVIITNMYKKLPKQTTGFIKSYGTTHFPIVQMSCNLQNVLEVVWLTFPQNFEAILKKLNFL